METTLHNAVRAAYQNAVTVTGNDANSITAFDVNGNAISVSPATIEAELATLQAEALIENCKSTAQSLLSATDWVTLSDVTTGSPRLTNQQDFLSYRSAVRSYAVSPVANPIWPIKPSESWE